MKIIRNIKNLQESIVNIPNLGFVPTMGGLHKGHLKLIKKSINRSQKTLVSIYVNPTQFNKKKDFSKYPGNTKKDLKILKRQKVDFVFLPKTGEMYKRQIRKNIKIHRKKNVLCGKFRKGHFEGVIDVIDRFLSLINPKYIFLGEKDFQQLFLIKNYVKNKFKVKVVSCKTVRDKNYVALSSRNFLLSKKNLATAGKIAKKLKSFKNRLKNNQNFKKSINNIKNKLIEKYNIKLEYLELRNEKDLSVFKKKNKFRIFISYYINKVRLIDNF